MSTTSEQGADPAGLDVDATYQTARRSGDGQAVRTGEPSGIRSSTGGSVEEAVSPPGPTLAALRKLSRDLDNDDEIVDRFVVDYLSLLDHRLSVLGALLSSGGPPEAIRLSILSLETTSAMIGAVDVVTAARELRRAVARHDEPGVWPLYVRLVAAGDVLGRTLADPEVKNRQQPRPVA